MEGFLLGAQVEEKGNESRSLSSAHGVPPEKAGRCGDPNVINRLIHTHTPTHTPTPPPPKAWAALFPPSKQKVASLMPKRVYTEAPLFSVLEPKGIRVVPAAWPERTCFVVCAGMVWPRRWRFRVPCVFLPKERPVFYSPHLALLVLL